MSPTYKPKLGPHDHFPVELFGFLPEDKGRSAIEQRRSLGCPFSGQECIKKLYRTDEPPSGFCTVAHLGKPCIICPNCFLENDKQIILEAAKLVLGDRVRITLVPEVSLPKGFGRVDWIGAVLDGDDVIDFVPIETHANQTTQTGALTKALREYKNTGKFSSKHYNYGINHYHQIKTFFTQCLNKSQLFSSWKKKFVWIIEEHVFNDWLDRFGLNLPTGLNNGEIIFKSYGLDFNKSLGRYALASRKTVSTDRTTLLSAYSRPTQDLPKVKEFIENIKRRLNR